MPRSTRRSFVTLPAKTELTGCFSRRVGRVGAEAVQPPALLMGMLCTWYDFEIISPFCRRHLVLFGIPPGNSDRTGLGLGDRPSQPSLDRVGFSLRVCGRPFHLPHCLRCDSAVECSLGGARLSTELQETVVPKHSTHRSSVQPRRRLGPCRRATCTILHELSPRSICRLWPIHGCPKDGRSSLEREKFLISGYVTKLYKKQRE